MTKREEIIKGLTKGGMSRTDASKLVTEYQDAMRRTWYSKGYDDGFKAAEDDDFL